MTAPAGLLQAAAAAGRGPDAAAAVDEALDAVAAGLAGGHCDLAVVFFGAAYSAAAEALAERVRRRLAPAHLLGVTASGVVAGPRELERPDAVAVWGATLPAANLVSLRYQPPDDAGQVVGWIPPPQDSAVLLLLADPFSFPAEAFLRWAAQARPGVAVSGGLASAAARPGVNRLLLDGQVLADGAVAVAIGGGVSARALVSQGCRPVGRSWVVTDADGNVVRRLAGQPAAERIQQVFGEADPAERALLRGGLHLGVVVDEYRDEFASGDFLVRNVLGADPETGAVVVGDTVEVGQTVALQVRDAASADAELRALLDRADAGGAAALLFTCNGRGERMFGQPDHDASVVAGALAGGALAGCFCAGEFGPVGQRSYLHGFTASLLLLAPADVTAAKRRSDEGETRAAHPRRRSTDKEGP